MFRKIYNVKTLNLGQHFDTSKVTNMFAMFEGGYYLENIILGDKFKTDEVTNMSRMFAGCWYLKDLDFSNFNTKNVTDMSYMFNDATAFRNFTNTAKFNTEKVTTMGYIFGIAQTLENVDKLEKIYVNNDFNTACLTSYMDYTNMFTGRTKLRGGNGSYLSDPASADLTWLRVDRPGVQGYFTRKS